MRLLEKIARTFFYILIVFIIFLVIIVLFNFFQINILKKQYTNFCGFTIFEVTTGSMSGTIEINDVVLVKITKDVTKNDIITFINKNEVITHRVIAENENELFTKGDANNGEAMPIQKSNVIGKVVKIFPKFGIWIKVISDVKVVGSIIVTIILFGMAISSKDEKKEHKKKKSFSKFMRNRREKRNGKSKEKKES